MLDNNKLLEELKNKKNKLEKKDIDLIICDFDDTIFSTHEFLESNIRDWRRWAEWNKYLLENDLIDKSIKSFYINKKFPKTITSKLRKNHDVILTAWLEDFQTKKAKATNLEHINMVITDTWKDKIFETINYVINTLDFIPNKITIYEDRPYFFVEYKDFLENFLWTKLEIMFVEMINNSQEPKITQL